MDVFKVLSRATKFSKGAKPTAAISTPSSGQNANPQLFRAPVHPENERNTESAVLGKRKRQTSRDAGPQLDPGIDFFAGKSQAAGPKKATSFLHGEGITDGISPPNSRSNGLQVDEEMGLADAVEERKRILRTHRIKITVSNRATAVELSDSGKVKKKKKSKLKEPPPPRKPAQLYPRPLSSFHHLGPRFDLHHNLTHNLLDQGYTVPTEVQLAALPLLLPETDDLLDLPSVRPDLLSIAPTGSGKTLAFLIPIVDALIKDRQRAARTKETATTNGPSAVIVAPTRELANQIVNEARKLVQKTGIKVALVRKGMVVGAGSQEQETRDEGDSGAGTDSDGSDQQETVTRASMPRPSSDATIKADILVSTPLTLLNALKIRGGGMRSLTSVQHLVLDEADVLLDPLFKEQTIAIWDVCANPHLRSTLWSATMPSSIETLALDMLAKSRPDASTLRLVVGLKDTSLPTIAHTLTYAATETGKLLALRQILHPTATTADAQGRKALRPPFLVFTQTIERAIALHAELKFDIPPEAGGSTRVAVLHSGLSESARGKVMASFRKGEVWVIITTDLLARGVDFRGLNGVVNYDVPTSAAAYVHRVGRTGRAGREGGTAVTFYTKEDIPFIKSIANVIAASEKLRPASSSGAEGESGVQQWLLDALPTPSKRAKKELKRKGVEGRRKGVKGERISTKTKFDRKIDTRRREARRVGGRKGFDGEGGEGFEG